MSYREDHLRPLSFRELLWGMTFFLIPPLGLIVFFSKSSPEGYFLGWTIGAIVFFVAVALSPIGVTLGETTSPNYSNLTRAVVFFISGLVFCFGWVAIPILGLGPVCAIVYASLGPILIPAIVAKLKNLL